MKKFLLVLVCLVSACCTNFLNIGGIDKNKVFSSTTRILAINKKGSGASASGFAIDKDRIMTAAHFCVEATKKDISIFIDIYAKDKENMIELSGATIERMDVERDICVLKLKNHGIVPLKIAKYSTVKPHDQIFEYGSPHSIFQTYFEGKVILKDGPNHLLVIDSPATHGVSGGPVLNDNGEVIGMVIMVDKDFNHLTYCVPAWSLQNFIDGK